MKRGNFSSGDKVLVTTKSEDITGIFLPSQNESTFVLKLDSGYNTSIKKSDIISIKLLQKHMPKSRGQMKALDNKNLPTISILHCGGTVAARVDYKTGAVSAQFSPEELIQKFPELKNKADIRSRLISNMFSGNMRFHDYNAIAREIEKEVKNTKGIIITHGTDTLHYTAAALAFILENMPIPVILVGSQRSSDRPSTDAALNLIHAARFILEANFHGVAICMHSSQNDNESYILPACKSRKLHTSRRDAFKPVNADPIAIIGKEITMLEKQQQSKEGFSLKQIKESVKVGIVKIHPNFYASQLDPYKRFNALILEGTGLGHAPIEKTSPKSQENLKILGAIKALAKKMPVIMTSQCIFGRTNLNIYSYGRKLKEIGVINDNSDISSETALIKAAWLLSNHKKYLNTTLIKNIFLMI